MTIKTNGWISSLHCKRFILGIFHAIQHANKAMLGFQAQQVNVIFATIYFKIVVRRWHCDTKSSWRAVQTKGINSLERFLPCLKKKKKNCRRNILVNFFLNFKTTQLFGFQRYYITITRFNWLLESLYINNKKIQIVTKQ